MRVALVQDWLTGLRGGEKVLDELVGLFPDADLYTLVRVPHTTTERIERLRIVASPLSRLPGAARHYRKLLPLFPWAIERFALDGYDLVLSNSHSFAKGVRVGPGAVHLCYCLTPIRYAWDLADDYLGSGVKRVLAEPLLAWLRRWDRRTSTPSRIARVIAISHYIAERVKRAWGREASVIYPPVDVARFASRARRAEDFFLLVGGFVPYKAEALALEAFAELGWPLVVAGDGPTRAALQARAPANVKFLGRVSDPELESLYSRARALVYPQEEDFGIIAVEAQAAGSPVIALGRGGAAETVVGSDDREGRAPTGLFFRERSSAALLEALRAFAKLEAQFSPAAARANAARFATERFQREMRAAVQELAR